MVEPETGSTVEAITPYHVSLCMLLRAHLDPASSVEVCFVMQASIQSAGVSAKSLGRIVNHGGLCHCLSASDAV